MYYQSQEDETLVMLTLAGEQRAYEILVVRHQKAVMAAALSVTHKQFMAEDATQDAFVTAWMKLNTLQDPAKFAPWVSKIAKNCAKNTVMRLRSYMPLETADTMEFCHDSQNDPAEQYRIFEEQDELHTSIGSLPEKVRQIIHLHYFDGLSIAEIADKLRISSGTVKWQLHDGRKRIRKELCAVNEKWNDTLVQRVMKKVEELKLWQIRNDKSGFEAAYKDILREIEELPESKDKNHALADLLMRGWWWLPGEKNDALFERITHAAQLGKNEEVMAFIVAREDSRVYGDAKIDFIRNKQIPRLEKAGFVQALGREWFWLGYHHFRKGQPEEGHKAYDKVQEILGPADAYHALVPYGRAMEELLAGDYNGKPDQQYVINATAQEYRYLEGELCFWNENGFGEGRLSSMDRQMVDIFHNASRCDSRFFADIAPGETHVGSDGTTLTFAAEGQTVTTPAGVFDGCQLWVTRLTKEEPSTFETYYKEGIGIVKQVHLRDGLTDERLLCGYHITGGTGLLPMAAGNTWEYAAPYDPDYLSSQLTFKVDFADDKTVLLSSWKNTLRKGYDQDSWLDMIQLIRNEYHEERNGEQYICDVSAAIARAEALAKTPMEQAHTKVAASVARRIMATDPTFNPQHTATGHWNFFNKNILQKKNGVITMSPHSVRWAFEWKSTGSMGDADTPLLYNDIYGILQDAVNCIWSDEWRPGALPLVEYTKWDWTIKTRVTCQDGGTVVTKAGVFDRCLKLCLDIGGLTDGWSYRGGKKAYYFAKGVGIVRTENQYCGGAKTAVYELTSYEGTGDGYMPIEDGMKRRYDALDLTDGFVGGVEYLYVADGQGGIALFGDQIGIRQLPPPITQYAAIQGEMVEDRLWQEGNYDESRLRNNVNNFHLLTHFLGRPSRYWGAPEKAIAWNQYRLRMVEGLSPGKEIPPAWYGFYTMTAFRTGCALFGCGRREEGYAYLDKAFSVAHKWLAIPKGDPLDVGDPLIYGGIQLIKDKGLIQLPDGSKESLSYDWIFQFDGDELYYGMTAPRGWEWFDPVRQEERFKQYIERAKILSKSKE